ncbi:protein Tob1-like [Centruroides vittatus]|uniref:Protein Tob1 n=1 Tax=Centruroides hentzi TaxID=88313 RepID=A0A2I9LPS8_9SCOR
MHVEIQVALNFFISFLYNKLPRRRVNQFGEELEKALKLKFQGHWYPEKPYKGSGFRCLKTTPPLDPVFEIAARDSGMDLVDIQENLPQELSIWIDPGEVSYRMGEKGQVKILYSEMEGVEGESNDREITKTFNPEAQCFKPVDSMACQLGNLNLTTTTTAPTPYNSSPSPTYKSGSPVNTFIPKSSAPLTFTTATFAQTKFGSTKLKTNTKRCHRLSPTEFNYIKQRAIVQQQNQQQQQGHPSTAAAMFAAAAVAATNPQRPRSLSPNPQPPLDPSFLLLATGRQQQQQQQQQQQGNQGHFSPPTSRSFGNNGVFDSGYLADFFTSSGNNGAKSQQGQRSNAAATNNRLSLFFDKQFATGNATNTANGLSIGDTAARVFGVDGVNFNLNVVSYPNQYQHLLMAN